MRCTPFLFSLITGGCFRAEPSISLDRHPADTPEQRTLAVSHAGPPGDMIVQHASPRYIGEPMTLHVEQAVYKSYPGNLSQVEHSLTSPSPLPPKASRSNLEG